MIDLNKTDILVYVNGHAGQFKTDIRPAVYPGVIPVYRTVNFFRNNEKVSNTSGSDILQKSFFVINYSA
jgi:hypothetical protein